MRTEISPLWVSRPKPSPKAQIRLFCFPYAGGGASTFYPWVYMLPPEIEVCAVQFPGRENRLKEEPFSHLSPLIFALARALHGYLDVPFAFFGHSMGSLVSFELTRYLRQEHRSLPACLFVSGYAAPQRKDAGPHIHHLPDTDFIAAMRALDGTSENVLQNAEIMQLFLPTLRADFAICETYVYADEEPLDCPILVFGGREDHTVSDDALRAWSAQTRCSCELSMFPGNHFFLHTARALLLQKISEKLVYA
jgi:medium-chain acyl-[acyl-carrier-protein] hydrolase